MKFCAKDFVIDIHTVHKEHCHSGPVTRFEWKICHDTKIREYVYSGKSVLTYMTGNLLLVGNQHDLSKINVTRDELLEHTL